MRGLIARVRSFWRGLRRPEQLDAEMDEEMRFHIEMEADRVARERGVDAREARRVAAAAFGGVEKYKEAGRDARGVTGITGVSLDVKLGVRMLAKSPGLTLVGGLGMAVAVAIGIGFYAVTQSMLHPRLPLPEGERIVALENWNVEERNEERRSVHDLVAWRGEMRSVREISAFRPVDRGLLTANEPVRGVRVAEMTASAFRVARVPPLLGRYLVDEDERQGAPPVVVIGHDAWRKRFAGDPGVVGRAVQLDTTTYTVVGVMPAGFRFPVRDQYWTPLRADPSRHARGEGPEIFIFGRLAPGATTEAARAELAAIGRRAARAYPATHARLTPQLLPYTYPIDDIQNADGRGVAMMQLFVSLLLVVVAVNVAVLVYARTATRRGEIAVRGALGATRRRIVTQLVAEALVLSGAAALLGLALAQAALWKVQQVIAEWEIPVGFWVDFTPRFGTLAYTVALAVLAAAIVGVVPALQSTGRQLEGDLRQLGGSTGMRLGRTWSVLVVAQVAIAVAVLPAAVQTGWSEVRHVATRPAYPAKEFLGAGLGIAVEFAPGTDAAAFQRQLTARFGDRMAELVRRLESEPEVAGVSFRGSLPGRGEWVRVEGATAPPESPRGFSVISTGVGAGYLPLLGLRTLAGRPFQPGDLSGSATAVIASRSFVRTVLGEGNALGRRIRYVAPEGRDTARWYEIVGVVEDPFTNPLEPNLRAAATLFYPVTPAQLQRATLLVRLRSGDPDGFAPRLRAIAAAVDPALRLDEVRSLASTERSRPLRLAALAMSGVLATVLLLSAAGIHALMSFTVTQRRKEIGIRTALGARPGRLLGSVFSRALRQLTMGLAAGSVLGALLVMRGSTPPARAAVFLALAAGLMLATGLLATLGPARRGLRIQPMDALKAE